MTVLTAQVALVVVAMGVFGLRPVASRQVRARMHSCRRTIRNIATTQQHLWRRYVDGPCR